MTRLAVDCECAVLDSAEASCQLAGATSREDRNLPVGISPNNGSEVSVIGLGVGQILRAIVVTEDDVLVAVILVLDVEVGDASTVRDEGCIDAVGAQRVFLEWVAGKWRECRAAQAIITWRVLRKSEGGRGQQQRTGEVTHLHGMSASVVRT